MPKRMKTWKKKNLTSVKNIDLNYALLILGLNRQIDKGIKHDTPL